MTGSTRRWRVRPGHADTGTGAGRGVRGLARPSATHTTGGNVQPHDHADPVHRQVLSLQGIAGNGAVARVLSRTTRRGRVIQRNGPKPPPLPDFRHRTEYESIMDKARIGQAFRLTLTRNRSGMSGLLTKLAKATKGLGYQDLENNTDRFGLPEKPGGADLYKAFLTDYLLRAMLTATDVGGGGLAVNLAGYHKENLAVITAKYQKLLAGKQEKEPGAKYLSHQEFMGSDFSESEVRDMGLDAFEARSYSSPGFTDWEIATIMALPEILAGAEFYDDIRDIHESGWSDSLRDYQEMGIDMEEMEEVYGLRYLLSEKLLTPRELKERYGITQRNLGK